MLRKPDRRRSTTQTWSFRDGKLTCGIHGLVVQVSIDYTLNMVRLWLREMTESFGLSTEVN